MQRIKKGDLVRVIRGDETTKEGIVLKVLPKQNAAIVEGVNISKKHSKPRTNNDKGGIFDIEMPIHVSNVKLVDSKEVKKESKKEEKTTSKKSTKKASK